MSRLIDADRLKAEIFKACMDNHFMPTKLLDCDDVTNIIDNAPTVVPEEMKPLIDKVVEIIPQLTDAIVEQLPKVVENSLDICYDCEYRRKARGDV